MLDPPLPSNLKNNPNNGSLRNNKYLQTFYDRILFDIQEINWEIKIYDNLTPGKRNALQEFKYVHDIIINPTVKGEMFYSIRYTVGN